MKHSLLAGLLICLCHTATATEQPNIVLILADHVGFSDIAPYGSEINTPTLSQLANTGIRFSNYHTAASCAPSRAMLLTGVDSHRNGVPNIPEALPASQRAYENYQGTLNHRVVTVASLLEAAGYRTYMSGKWHLGMAPDQRPSNRGFERTVAMMDTGADNWEQRSYLPIYEQANWFSDGERFDLPENFYSSRFLVDKMIEFIDAGDGAPFFAYLPFMAVHIPVQAPQEFTDRYLGAYDEGWTVLRSDRRERAIELGLVPEGTPTVTMATTGDWDSLPAERQRYESKRMAVYAGMLEAMDFHIGRLVRHLKASGQYDNTIFIFTSDNGSEATGFADATSIRARMAVRAQRYESSYERMGLKGSFMSIGASFASASASPLAFYKFYAGEGGMRVPLIVSGKPLGEVPAMTHAFTYVTDIAPTILELAGVRHPGTRWAGRQVESMVGRSLLPLLRGEAEYVHPPDSSIGYEVAGNAALFRGDYKLVLNRGPVGDGQWHLYNLREDPGETRDLAVEMPELHTLMLAEYAEYVRNNHVLPVPEGYSQVREVAVNGLKNRYGGRILALLVTAALVLSCILCLRKYVGGARL